jgi:FAD/FMN-containing dehydrogenase
MLDTPERTRSNQIKLERTIDPLLLARFAAIVGNRYAITDPQMQAPYMVEMRDLFHGRTPLVLRPGSVGEVAAIVKLANETGTPIVPQGGNTGWWPDAA